MKVLVTGANGFLGSWLTRRLCQEGHRVSVLIRGSSDISEIENFPVEKKFGDVTDLESLFAAFRGQEAIFHLAGLVAYRASDRVKMETVNIRGTRNVVNVLKDLNIPELVYLSSVVAVGAGFTQREILNENSEYNLSHLNLGYFETKRIAELYVREQCANDSFRGIILNPSTIYGGGDAKKGSRGIQVKVAKGRMPFYPIGGVNVVAVEDVVDGIMAAWKKGRSGERYILCGENMTIQELFKTIAGFAGVRPPRWPIPFAILRAVGWAGDQLGPLGVKLPFSLENAWTSHLYHWFDCTKAKTELGFQPTPSADAIEKSVRWMKDRGLLNS
jgi:dihydroflavonol-4-reductase